VGNAGVIVWLTLMINGGPVTGVLNGISKGFTGGSMENHLDMVKSGLSFDGDILEKK